MRLCNTWMNKKEEKQTMWTKYNVELQFTAPFASSTPKNSKEIEAMLEARMPAKAPPDPVSIPELARQIAKEVGTEPNEAMERGYATFKRDDNGLYYEARCVRAHIKDCSNALQKLLDIKALKSKVAQRVYVEPEKLYLGKKEPDGSETRIIHAMTMQGPRSSFKTIDYVLDTKLSFTLKVLDDGMITRKILEAIFEYGGTHGMGQERSSNDFGKYFVAKFEEV